MWVSISEFTASRPRHAACAALLAALLAVPGAAGAQERPAARGLTVVSWGGAYARSQILGFIRDYETASGIDVELINYNGGLDEIRDQVEAYNVRWDAVALEPADAIAACRDGLLEPIDVTALAPAPDGTPAAEDFVASALTPCAIGSMIWATVVAYDTGAFGDRPPARLADFFDTDRYPGRRGMRRTPRVNLEWALIADGVAADAVYATLETEAGLQRAFRMLDRIKPAIVWWQSGTEAPRLLESGRVAMSTAYNGRIDDAIVSREAPLAIVWERQIFSMDLWGIPANGEHTDLAREFVRFATRSESLAAQTEWIAYGPTRRSALAGIDPAVRARLPTTQDNFRTALELDAAWWAENLERLTRRFEDWIAKPVRVPEALPR